MSIAEKLTTVAENVPKVYKAGKQTAYDRFWDDYQYNGTRTDYSLAFGGIGWTDKRFTPKYSMTVSGGERMFYGSRITNLKAILQKCGVSIDFSQMHTATYFLQNSHITDLGILDLRSVANLGYVFTNSHNLKNVDKIILKSDGTQVFVKTMSFQGCTGLENVIFEGCIGKNEFNVQWSTKLSHDSLLSILNCLKDYSADTSGTSWVVTIGETNMAKLTEDELAIASNKGWAVM